MRIRTVALALMLSLVAAVAAQDAAKVESFSPQGQIKDVRQVVVRFSQPMVSFGDPRSEAPFDIACASVGRGRWADARNWLYDFDQDLQAGIECTFKTKAGLKSFAGAEVAAQTFRFSTGGPSIRGAWPDEGEERIDEAQVFMLALDAHADLASVRANAYCAVDGIGERLPLAIVEGKERERILAEQKNRARVLFEVITKRGNRGIAAVKDVRLVDAPILVASCGRPLPAGAHVRLVWGAGIKTTNGIATSEVQTLPYQVRPQFSARFTCQRVNANAGCIPVLPAQLEFTAPVARDLASKIEIRAADGQVHRPTIDRNVATVDSVEFKGPFVERSEATISLPGDLKDDAGRALANAAAFPMKVRIDDDPPLVKFPSRFGILEVNAQPALPVTVRNVEPMLDAYALDVAKAPKVAAKGRIKRIDTDDDAAVAQWMRRILREPSEDIRRDLNRNHGEYLKPGTVPMLSDAERSAAQPIDIPRAEPKMAMQVIGIPLPQTGLYAVEIASRRLGQALHAEDKPYYVSGGALVTNLAVHFKHGRESSLAWVTRLDDGKPVAGAQVRVTDCLGKRWWDGATDASGIARIERELPRQSRWQDCPHASNAYIVSARIDGDMSLMLTSWNEGIRPWQFNLGGGSGAEPVIAHTVFDRALFRAGETVSMKHVIRRRVGTGFAAVETRNLPRQLQLIHSGSGQQFELPVTWSNGTALSTWNIPKDAKLGEYTVLFVDSERGRGARLQGGSFRVEQFRVPLMKAVLKPPSKTLVNPSQVTIDAQLSYLSGGPAAGAPVKFRSRIVPSSQSFADYDEFSFGGAVPKVGIEAEAPYDETAQDEPEATGGAARVQNVSLDASGGARVVFDKLAHVERTKDAQQTRALEVEMEYADPNGQILTAFTQTLLTPSALVVGLAPDGSFFKRDSLRFKAVILDNAGKPQAGKDVSVDAYSRTRFAYRKRLLGGFYAYEQTVEIKRLKQVCSGTSDVRGLVLCSGSAPTSGDLILVARVDDAQGNAAIATRDVYVAGNDDGWFEAGQSDRIDLIADKRSYEPGEAARYEVRMPYRTATALISIEREGVLESRVVTIDSKSPYIEVPMLGHYGPNAYVSVLVVRGRIEPEMPGRFAWLKRMMYRAAKFVGLVDEVPVERDTRPTALVDLTKPSYRLGMAQVKVGWKAYELRVKVEPEKPVYKVRDRAAVIVTVTDPNGKPMANAELAVAAVDEGLLALASNRSWDLLGAMMQRRPIEVETSTAQSQVIGKRHFGKKAVAAGGGGGGENARELFDTLLMWNPRVTLDENGRARIEVPLNDSLTSFRIEAIANTTSGESRFGSGGAAIRTTQDVMIFAGLPPFVREGDRFDAQVTVRNGADRPLELAITATMGADGIQGTKLPPNTLSLAAGGAQTISLPAQVPFGVKQLQWQITARETNTTASDTIKISQSVGVAVPVRVYQQTLLQLEPAKATSFPVELPKGAIAGRGGVEVKLARSLGGSAETIKQWMAAYPFTCLEQRASVAVALEDPTRWQRVMDSLPALLDRDGLAKFFPSPWNDGDDTLTTYLLTIASEAGYEIPEAARDRMLRGLADFVAGRVVRYTALPTADLAIRKIAAIDALARYGKAEPRMLESIEIAPNLWPTSAVLDWMSLLKKLQTIPKRNERLAEAQQILRSRMTFSGTTLVFSTEKSDYLWWLMVSPDRNAVRSLALLSDDASFKDEMPRMARGALSRQQAGKWNTTLANAWGVLALRRFQSRFESEAVTGRSIVSVGNDPHPLDWKAAQSRATNDPTKGTPIGTGVDTQFAWPETVEPLSIVHEGSGRPWAFITSRAALPLQAPLFAGYQIKRTVTPIEQKTANVWARGDVYRVTLEVDAQADMTWVVISDPIPAGAAVLGSGLGGDSRQLTSNERRDGQAWPAYEERAFEGFRAYYRYVPKGKLKLEYTVRLNNAGAFSMPPTRVEAMYAPESFGELPVASIEVRP